MSKFGQEIKRRFPKRRDLMRALGLDENTPVGGVREALHRSGMSGEQVLRRLGMDSRSLLEVKDAFESMAQHGHGWDDEWAARVSDYAAKRGWDCNDGDLSSLWEMLPQRQAIVGEPHERGTEDDGEPEGHELENARNMRASSTNLRREYQEGARETERPDSTQSEDVAGSIKKNAIGGGLRGQQVRMAGDDSHLLWMFPELARLTPSGGYGRERSTGPNNPAMDSMNDRAALLKRLDRLCAR
jgi:hypothetical protein